MGSNIFLTKLGLLHIWIQTHNSVSTASVLWDCDCKVSVSISPVSWYLSESNEFILYAVRNSIHRYDLATGTDQALPLAGLREAVALDFDYDRNCLYWADISLDTIQVSEDADDQEGFFFLGSEFFFYCHKWNMSEAGLVDASAETGAYFLGTSWHLWNECNCSCSALCTTVVSFVSVCSLRLTFLSPAAAVSEWEYRSGGCSEERSAECGGSDLWPHQ